MAVCPEAKLTELLAVIVNPGEAEAVNLNIAVALWLILPDVPMIVTAYVPATMELQESVALRELFEIVAGTMGVHSRSAGGGRSERVMFPVKCSIGFTMMVDVARLVPSAGATLGRVAPIVKSGTIIELNIRGSVRCDSDVCGVHTAKLSTNTTSSVLLNRRQVGESRDGSDISRPGCDDKMGVCAFFPWGM